MSEDTQERCGECGAQILPGRRFCVACLAQVPGARPEPKDRLTELMREIPSTRRPDKTLVFVPELREARLRKERRNKRAFIAAMISVVVLAAAGFAVWRVNERKQTQAQSQRRESMARRELDLYAKALETFYADFGRYPTVKEGLASLARQPATLAGWRGPYVEGDYSVDPWGVEYVYQTVNDGKGYILSTYGPEGEASGRPFLQVHVGTSGPIEDRK
ncbi:MAG TPA: type II secretion system protein GspG [Blastocatellia bacterium]|jgi:general secretion pathway protein G|nr:type II secretion system protein GspG [Blastocatellia bacterium]